MAKYVSGRQKNLKVGISSYSENLTSLEVIGNVGIATTNATSKLYVVGDGYFTGVVTALSFSGNTSSATYATSAGVATYATISGIATYATSAGVATYATISGISTYATIAGIATYATNAGISTYATNAGISTYAANAGISTYSTIAGVATYATSSGISTYATNAGISTYATIAGVATYATNAGVATALQNSRTFEITGDIVASPISFNGTGNVSLAATIQPNSVSLGSDTTGDYVQSISGTANQITVTGGTGEGSTPIVAFASNPTIPGNVTIGNDLQVNNNLNVTGNITVGGTTAYIIVQDFRVTDADITLGFTTNTYGNDASTDTTANHGGIAIASTEGNPLVQLVNVAIGESLPATYKKFMWFKAGSFAGLNTDAWLSNYAIGIGSTQFPSGTRLAAGSVQFTERDLAVVRNINSSGIITGTLANNLTLNTSGTGLSGSTTYNNSGATTFTVTSNATSNNTPSTIVARDASGNFSAGTITANLTGTASTASFATTAYTLTDAANITTGTINSARLSGTYNINISGNAATATYATNAGTSTSVIGGIASVTGLSVSGISTLGITSTTNLTSQQSNVSGISTVGSLNIGSTQVISSARQLQNISSLDATTTATIESAIANAPNTFTDLQVTGISTLGITSTTNLTTQQLNVSGVSTFSGITTHTATIFGTQSSFIGVVTASSFSGSGSNLTGIVTQIIAGTNISIDPVGGTGSVTVNSNAITGVSISTNTTNQSQYLIYSTSTGSTTGFGVSTSGLVFNPSTNNLGIATTNPTSKLHVIGDGYFTGVVTATTFVGNLTGTATTATNLSDAANITTGTINSSRLSGSYNIDINGNAATATYATTAGIATYATNAGLATYATSSGIATYATNAGVATYSTTTGVSTSVIGGIASITQLSVSGISTFSNGPVFIGAATSTGTESQSLQITGGAYVSGNLGIGTTNPTTKLDVSGVIRSGRVDTGNEGGQIELARSTDNATAWYVDVFGNTSTPSFRIVDATAAASRLSIDSAGTVSATKFSGDGSLLTGIAAGIAVQDEGSTVGTSVTTLNFSGATVSVSNAVNGISTITVTASGIVTYVDNAGISTNLKGGLAGNIPYQSAPDSTTFLVNGDSGTVLQSNGVGNPPSWVSAAPSNAITGLTVRDEGSIVGGANSVSQLNFVGNIVSIASTSGIATVTFLDYVSNAGVATYAISSGIATYATNSGIATYATSAGIATYATSAGIATYSTNTGIATYATTAGLSTSVIGGIASITQLNVSGVTTLGITSTTNLTSQQLNVSGISTLGIVQISSGIVTATSGIVTYYGDGSKLSNIGIKINKNNTTVGTGITTVNFTGSGISTVTAASGIATVTVPGTSKSITYATATAGQTSFSATYSVGFVDVFMNGVKLSDSSYTATTGTTIVLNEGASLGDVIEIIGYVITSPTYNITISTSDPTGGANGDIWIKYTA